MTTPRLSILRAVPLVGAGAVAGAGCRWLAGEVLAANGALVLVNALGCVVIGWVAARKPQAATRLVVATGFCGGLTTLSSAAVAVAGRFDQGRAASATLLLFAVVVASGLGYVSGRRLGMLEP